LRSQSFGFGGQNGLRARPLCSEGSHTGPVRLVKEAVAAGRALRRGLPPRRAGGRSRSVASLDVVTGVRVPSVTPQEGFCTAASAQLPVCASGGFVVVLEGRLPLDSRLATAK
jgi:hypothetical protein